MDTKLLVEPSLFAEGKKLIKLLDNENLIFSFAGWIYNSEAEEWRLTLAKPEIRNTGKLELLKKIASAIKENSINIPFHLISLIDTEEDLIKNLSMFKTGNVISNISLSGNYINGKLLPDIQAYRIN